jgi:hypothetical protein
MQQAHFSTLLFSLEKKMHPSPSGVIKFTFFNAEDGKFMWDLV